MTQKELILSNLKRTAEAIAVMFGNSCETIVHDMSEPGHPIVAIFNSGVSGRSVGSTDDIFDKNLVTPDSTAWQNYLTEDVVNAFAKTKAGKYIKSTTLHYEGKGYHYALGINYDYTQLNGVATVLAELTATSSILTDQIVGNVGDSSIEAIFSECVGEIGIPVAAMNRQEKLRLIALLEKKHAFAIRKSVEFVAEQLGVSRYTLYKYRQNLIGNIE